MPTDSDSRFRIRLMEISDLSEVAALRAVAFEAESQTRDLEQVIRARDQQIESLPALVATIESGEVIGYSLAHPLVVGRVDQLIDKLLFEAEDFSSDTGYIDTVAVAEPFRHAGVGGALVDGTVKRLRDAGYLRVHGHIRPAAAAHYGERGWDVGTPGAGWAWVSDDGDRIYVDRPLIDPYTCVIRFGYDTHVHGAEVHLTGGNKTDMRATVEALLDIVEPPLPIALKELENWNRSLA